MPICLTPGTYLPSDWSMALTLGLEHPISIGAWVRVPVYTTQTPAQAVSLSR